MSEFKKLQRAADAAEHEEKRQIGGWHCPRCLGTQYEVGEMHVAGSFLGKVFDIEGTQFSSVTCVRCRYTEFYKAKPSQLDNLFDLFVG